VRFGALVTALYLCYSVVTDLAIWGGMVYYWWNGGF
tara:strand:+ start:647 stop:754 length:108 start_codon:yes stop_codon:yes gene_type:complete